jgi:hypothetical protein
MRLSALAGILTTPRLGAARVLAERAYRWLALGAALLFFCFYALLPVSLIPGNSVAFELAQLTAVDWTLLVLLAGTTGLLVAFEWFAFRRVRASAAAAGTGGAGILASLVGGVLAAASCGCGIGLVLGVFGLGGATLFIVAHQMAFTAAMLGVVLVGLYFSARRALGVCAA